ncbi:MAG: HEAT repeat domain-containing protein, partial [Candidatus Marinimicrobia bacterium]|nr:HEAT repeat domain-containing protein [Candidatus Neomarinimicrobiota bacterium]
TYHWRENVPHVTYLVSLIAGEFTEIRDSWNDVPVLYYVQPGHADMAMRSFEKTPDMIDYFSRVIGYDYPYEKYAQTTIVDFMWGGMENISATTLTEYTLHDEVAHLDFSSDGLVAHELAHQWWGDLLTTKNWNHLWLNEAFATYFDALYVEHDKGEGEFLLELIDNRRRYLEEDKHNYRRPIVYDLYEDPSEMFDVHSYQKGSLVLHMIRYLLGDELWWQAIRHYADTHAGQTVETNDFKQAIEDATGYPMDRFFEQWLYSAGHPEYSVKWKWDNKQTAVVLDVKQVQQVDDLTPLFAMPVDIALYGEFGAVTRRIDVDQVEESFILGAPSKPARVSFDPEDWLLKELSFEKSKKELIEQLRNGGKAERLQAATWLAGKSGKTVARALGLALREDPFRGVRAEAARSLGKLRTKTARDELLTGLNDPDSRVCQAVTKALGRFRGDTGVAQALVEVFNSDQSYYVQANCLTALANTNVEDAAHTINSAFQRDSFKDIIRDSALVALTILKDPQSINTALEWAAYGQPVHVRVSAIQALGKMGAITPHRQKELGDKLMALLDDPHFKGRLAAIKALGDLGHPDAIPALQTAINEEYQFKLRSAARTAIKKIKQKNK